MSYTFGMFGAYISAKQYCRRSNWHRSKCRRSNCRRSNCRQSKCRRSKCRRSNCRRSKCRRSKCRRSKCLGAYVAEHLSHFSEHLSAEHMSPEHMSCHPDGGLLSCLDQLKVKFVPTPEISLGHIEESHGMATCEEDWSPWRTRLVRWVYASHWVDRRVAVGYCTKRGVDIIGIDDVLRVRILDDAYSIYSCLSEIENDVLAVCTVSPELFTYNISSAVWQNIILHNKAVE